MPVADGKQKALESTLASLKKKYGEGAVMKLGNQSHLNVDAIPSGAISLDLALGIGGVPRGRVTEIYGPESSGKTTLCLHIIAEAQKMGGLAAFIDTEHAFDPTYAVKVGVDVDNLYISQPDTGEQALEIAEALARSMAVDVIVVDSVAALVPRAEIEGEMGDSHMGLQARLMSQALRKLAGVISRSNTAVIFTNQLRMRIGVMYGNPETTTGGNALKFYASVRLDIRKTDAIKNGNEQVGTRVKVSVKKNKVAPPFRVAEFDVLFNEGISREGDILDVATEMGIAEKRGAYYSYRDTRLGQGREQVKEYLRKHPDTTWEIENQVRVKAGLPQKPALQAAR
ncbi:MAG: recombinase RecA [Chloroflexi bacterium]|nr:MAG: recombinase RecA [Chloroflexota bacterium]